MRRCGIFLLAIFYAACGSSPVEPAAPATPAVAEIARGNERAVTVDSDMRAIEPFTGDLDALAERGIVRILAAPSETHFESDATTQRGRTVDAAVAFEAFVNSRIAPRRVAVRLIAASESTLISDLLSGQGDIAANVLRTFERDEQVAFAKAVRTGIRELIVTGPGMPRLVSLEDAGGKTIHVRRDSDHHASLLRLNEQLKKIDRPPAIIAFAANETTDEALLDLVNSGKIPATLVDDYIYDAHAARLTQTAVNRDVAVSQDGEIAWVTRKGSPELLALVNEFFTTHRLSF